MSLTHVVIDCKPERQWKFMERFNTLGRKILNINGLSRQKPKPKEKQA